MPADITSPANERIKWLIRLRERRHRDSEGIYLVEGERLYHRALRAGMTPEITFVDATMAIETSGPTVTVEPAALDRASYRRRSQGVIGVFPQMDTRLESLGAPAAHALLLVAEAIEKPGNLGAMLRTAAAAGADALIAVGDAVDVHNPNVLRASTGAVFTVPLAITGWDQLEPWLEEAGVHLAAATPTATVAMWDADLTGPVAIVLGAEDRGLSARAVAAADCQIRIPQVDGHIDSLNVSVAAAVLLFEARRQREGPTTHH